MSKKFSKNIRKAEKVIEKIIGDGSYIDYEHDHSEPGFRVWSAIQPETSDILTGTYDFNNKGIVTSHSYTVRTSLTPDLFVSTELMGGKKVSRKMPRLITKHMNWDMYQTLLVRIWNQVTLSHWQISLTHFPVPTTFSTAPLRSL